MNVSAPPIEFRVDDLTGSGIIGLLEEHLQSMTEITPRESMHALNLEALRRPEITFWSAWRGGSLVGCGALKELNPEHGEVKSMRTARQYLRQGVASALLQHIISEAKRRGYRRLSLETGATEHFLPARKLYAKFGFANCGPFEGYAEDPHSSFMTLQLNDTHEGSLLDQKFALIQEHWRPKVVAELNGQELKLVKFAGVFPWHHHEKEDELFLVWRGEMEIEFRDRRVVLRAGDFCVVPRGVEHRTMAESEAQVLIFEPAATRNTGNIVDERFTAPTGASI